MSDNVYIGVDLGGTMIKAVLTNQYGAILHEVSAPTGDIPGQNMSDHWKNIVREHIGILEKHHGHPVSVIGISSPGTVNKSNTGVLSNGSKMLGIEGLVWSEYLDRPVSVLNDAHAALYAEHRLGAGKDVANILMMTLGTGVGGGIMINGQLVQGLAGRAGHIGHISIDKSGRMGIVNTPGSLENAVGENTVVERSYSRFKSTKEVVEAYRKGDIFGSWVWLNTMQALARGIISLINVLSPELIILGGGISRAGEALM
ncbi:MAG: ROK family protein, partial [Saprospiraceae bacterium]|nr:ROK family protein [Saprospiraceae bacterium]